MDNLLKAIKTIFVYCGDFVINMAEILDISYYEVNAIIFVIIWPLLTFGLIGIVAYQKFKLYKLALKKI